MTSKRISQTVDSIELSAIKEMSMRSAKVEGAASLAWGLPSFRTPEHIRQEVTKQLEADPDIGKYALPDGLPALREAAVSAHYAATGIEADPDRHVMITAGNTQGLNALLHVLLNPGDEVILTDPGFASHVQQVRLCGGNAVFWGLDESKDWSLDVEALPNLVSEKTKALILVSPSNPTGKIFSEAELRRIGQIAVEHDFLILLDDPYSHFLYENRPRYFNLASVPALRNHLVYLFTFSKIYAMSGWRLAYMILPDELKQAVLKVHDATIICAPRVSQIAGVAALQGDATHLETFESVLGTRRSLICERLDAVPDLFSYVKPEGAYYVFPRLLMNHQDSHDFAVRLLEEAHVTVTPGRAFGPAGEHHVRMAYCVSEDVINLAFDRIESHFSS